MDISVALNKTTCILSYDLTYTSRQILQILQKYYPDNFSHIFTSCPDGKNESSYTEDVVFVQAMQDIESCKWILIDDLQTFLNSTLRYRLNLIKQKCKGILILTHFGITESDLKQLETIPYQSMYLSIQPIQPLEITISKSPEDTLNQLLSLGFYGKQKWGISTCNIQWYQEYLSGLKFPTLTWELTTPIDKSLICKWNTWKEQEDGIFYFSQIPPLDLSNLSTIYFLDGWDESTLWLSLYQAYLQSQRTCPLRLNILIDTPEKQVAYEKFLLAYQDRFKAVQEFTSSLPVTICPKQKRLLIQLPVYV